MSIVYNVVCGVITEHTVHEESKNRFSVEIIKDGDLSMGMLKKREQLPKTDEALPDTHYMTGATRHYNEAVDMAVAQMQGVVEVYRARYERMLRSEAVLQAQQATLRVGTD